MQAAPGTEANTSASTPAPPSATPAHCLCRHELYPDYKAQRPSTPEAVSESVHRLHELLAVMDVPRLAVPGVEADDVIGTMATRGVAAGMEVAVASPDKVGLGLVLVHCTGWEETWAD